MREAAVNNNYTHFLMKQAERHTNVHNSDMVLHERINKAPQHLVALRRQCNCHCFNVSR